jgi:hypothetical protein
LGAGVILEGVQHAVDRRWLVARALCGAGRIRLMLPAGFEPGDYGACSECARLVRTTSGG